MFGKGFEVFTSVAQGGQLQGEGPQAEEKVLAESAFIHHAGEITVGGGDETEITFYFRCLSHGPEAFFLEHPKKGFLQGEWHLADFIEKEGAFVCGFDKAWAVLVCTGKGPFAVAEEGALHQGFGEGGAVHGDKIMIFSRAVVVDGTGEELFARTGFSGDEHTGVASGGSGDQVKTVADGFAFSNDGIEGELRPLVVLYCLAMGKGTCDGLPGVMDRRGFDKEVQGTFSDGEACRVGIPIAGDHDQGGAGGAVADAFDVVDAHAVRKKQVQETMSTGSSFKRHGPHSGSRLHKCGAPSG